MGIRYFVMIAALASLTAPTLAFEPIIIEKQGSFAVGGVVVEEPGEYDNNAPTPAGQSLHGDHL
jgi:hypothetical protein